MAKPGNTNTSWGGRFKSGPTETACAYTESQSYDRALYHQDIRASLAHAAMLGRQGILSMEEVSSIQNGLNQIRQEIEAGKFNWQPALEDVHMNIEARLTELIGETGKKLHTGRSRNDQVGLSFRLYVADQVEKWRGGCLALCRAFLEKARTSEGMIMPGLTHLQPAQPVYLAHHLLAYAGMFKRDYERLTDSLERTRISPLGAAALAGTTYPLDPRSVAEEVGFKGIYENSMDAVSDRDFVAEALFCASLIMVHLSRFCEELAIWANPAFGYLKLPDEFSTGSSIMPQKKNPDVAELMRGKTGRVYGDLVALLTILKGLPLAYNRDLQEDKEPFFDADRTVISSLDVMKEMLKLLRFNPDRMKAACQAGYINATELADYLTTKNIPFRDAHHATGKAVARAESLGLSLEDLPLSEFQAIHPAIEEDVYPLLAYDACCRRRETPGGTGPQSIKQQLSDLERWLSENEPV